MGWEKTAVQDGLLYFSVFQTVIFLIVDALVRLCQRVPPNHLQESQLQVMQLRLEPITELHCGNGSRRLALELLPLISIVLSLQFWIVKSNNKYVVKFSFFLFYSVVLYSMLFSSCICRPTCSIVLSFSIFWGWCGPVTSLL